MGTPSEHQTAIDDFDDLYTNDEDFDMDQHPSTEVINESTALQTLHDALSDQNANWKSEEQRESVMETLSGQRNIVSVMRTGGGKSMAWIIAALLQTVVTVVMVPFKRLLDQHLEQALSFSCKAMKWTSNISSFGKHNLIFMALESAASHTFQK
jgi:superfamily II DNA helicase RecQ